MVEMFVLQPHCQSAPHAPTSSVSPWCCGGEEHCPLSPWVCLKIEVQRKTGARNKKINKIYFILVFLTEGRKKLLNDLKVKATDKF